VDAFQINENATWRRLLITMISIVNYGLGNVHAFWQIYTRLGLNVTLASSPRDLLSARHIILPGVGAFDSAIKSLNESGMRETLDYLVLEKGVPVLGVCVGMQMMAHRSEEGNLSGLGWLPASVERFDITKKLPLPHMGWNDVTQVKESSLFSGLSNPRFYFLHSYRVISRDSSHILSTTDYGEKFVSAVSDRNIFGVQFHPEKSHHWGVKLLDNFSRVHPC